MVNPNVGTQGTSEILTDFPTESGLNVGDKHDGREINIVSEDGTHSFESKERVGLNE